MDEITKRLTQKGSPFELHNAIIKGIPCKIFPRGPNTIQDIFQKVRFFIKQEFIVSGNIRLSFGRALDQASRLVSVMRQQYNIEKGDRVALIMSNSPEWAIAFMALSFAGAVAVVMHAETEKQVTVKGLEITNCELIITDSQNFEKIKTVHDKYPAIILTEIKEPEQSLDETPRGNSDPNVFFFNLRKTASVNQSMLRDSVSETEPDDEAMISFTSGTTGDPKGIVLTHRNVTTGLMNIMLGGYMMNSRIAKDRKGKETAASNMPPCSLLIAPFSHISGYANILLMCYLGGKIVLMPEWKGNQAATLIDKEKIQSISGATPAIVRDLLRTNGSAKKLESLKNINIHGMTLHQNFIHEISEKFPFINIATGYGMTETSGSIYNVSGTELLKNPDTGGAVLPSVDIKIIDESGKELSYGEYGEICIRGANVMKGYCNDSNSASSVLNEGWLKTGDLGYLDNNGYLYVTDRIRDMLSCWNQKISAGGLERSITEHNMIDEAIVFGVPNSDNCESIVLAVLPNKTVQFDEKELKNDLFLKINKYSDRIKISIVETIPRTISGKVNRNELRKQILRGL